MLILLLKTLLRYCMFLFIFCETSHGRHLIYPISVLIHFIVITNVCILIVFTKFRKNVMGSLILVYQNTQEYKILRIYFFIPYSIFSRNLIF
jgi:hypothetical protein